MTQKFNSIFRSDAFEGQTIVITGGGSGIGRCLAHELVSLSAKVVIVGRSMDKLRTVASEIKEDYNVDIACYSVDIRDEEGVKTTVANILEEQGQVHGLVNNAGGQFPSPMEHISLNGFEAVIKTNLTGGFLMSREFYNQGMSKTGGSMVNITADNFKGMPGMAHSGAARAGMENLTKTAAIEWAKSGVRVNAVAPGYIASSGMDTYDKKMIAPIIRHAQDSVPLRRMGLEAEVSSAIVYLLSDAAAYITGVTMRVDGGSAQTAIMWQLEGKDNVPAFDAFPRAVVPEIIQELNAKEKSV
jgi:citronellol/citronellal dehydrogenase